MRIFPIIASSLITGLVTCGLFYAWNHVARSGPHSEEEVSVRPIAEFEPTFGMAVSDQILTKSHGVELVRAILSTNARVYLFVAGDREAKTDKILEKNNLSGPRAGIIKIQVEHEALWVRDFLPVPILERIPHLTPTPSFVDFIYRDGNTLDDAAIHQFALAINSSVRHLPIVLDGGNFMTNGDECVLSEEISEDPEVLLLDRKEPLVPDQLESIFRASIGCRETTLVSPIPHPHVDMWMKFLNKDTLIVNRLDPAVIEASTNLEIYDRDRSLRISRELDRAADLLSKRFKVIRLPMLPPHGDVYITYANAILANGKAIVPRYRQGFLGDRKFGAELFSKYEMEVEKTYRDFGLDVIFIEGDELIHDGGAFHCVTFHLPDLDAIVRGKGHLVIKPS